MRKIMKKLLTFAIAVAVVAVGTGVMVVNAEGPGTKVYVPGDNSRYAEFKITETLEETEFLHGIKHTKLHGETYASSDKDTSGYVGQWSPQQVNILEVPSSKDIKIVPWGLMNSGSWRMTSVDKIAEDYEAKHPGEKVIAATNGDFYDINGKDVFKYTPSSGHGSHGNFYRSRSRGSHLSTLGFMNDGTAESLIFHDYPNPHLDIHPRVLAYSLDIYDAEGQIVKTVNNLKYNEEPGAGETAVFYATWTIKTGWPASKIIPIDVEDAAIVEKAQYALPMSKNDFYGLGAISKIGAGTLAESAFAIKTNDAELKALLVKDVTIRVQNPVEFDYKGTVKRPDALVGASDIMMIDNKFIPGWPERHPRTIIGRKADGTIVMAVVDGRQHAQNMYGTSHIESTAILKYFGCVDAANLDGGGSSTFITTGSHGFTCHNSPSDTRLRSVANAVLVVVRGPEIKNRLVARSQDSIKVSAEVVATNGFQFDKMYLKIHGIADDPVPFNAEGIAEATGLASNTEYRYEIYGSRDGEPGYFPLLCYGETRTYRKVPVLTGFLLQGQNGKLLFSVNLTDPDGAVSSGALYYPSGDFEIINIQKGSILKEKVADLTTLSFELKYDILDGNFTQTVTFDMANLEVQFTAATIIIKDGVQQAFAELFAS